MASLRALLGLYPKTADVEATRAALEKEFEELNAYLKSDELEEFLGLDKTVPTKDFDHRKKQIKSQKYRDTEEYRKEKEFIQLGKNADIKNYYKINPSIELKSLEDFESSKEYEKYKKLEKLLKSDDYQLAKHNKSRREFKNSTEYQKEKDFISLKSLPSVKTNLKFKNSKKYALYLAVKDSDKLEHFESLKKFVQSDKFRKVKEYMLLTGNKKYELSDEYRDEQRYYELKKSDRVKWYFKVKDSNKFDELRNYSKSFDEEFTGAKLDRKKWMTSYFWGETILHDTYSLANEKQYISDGKNLEISNSVLRIITRREKAEGKAWNPKIGFFPREFDYTSGLISTGNSFRQKYGIFEAKIKFNKNFPVNHAFWMISEKMIPHVDVAKTQRRLVLGNFWGNLAEASGVKKKVSKYSLSKLSSDFYIYRLEWTPEKLVWKINGITVATAVEGVPQDHMYLVLSSSLNKDVNGTVLPAAMEIDWVRCYQSVN